MQNETDAVSAMAKAVTFETYHRGFDDTPEQQANVVIEQLAQAGYRVVRADSVENRDAAERPRTGRAAVVGEAIRTRNWTPVSDLDYSAWLNACRMADLALGPMTVAYADRIVEIGSAHPRYEEAMTLLAADWTTGNDRAKDAA